MATHFSVTLMSVTISIQYFFAAKGCCLVTSKPVVAY